MRIGIDARKIYDTGIGRHISNLVDNLLEVDGGHHYVLFVTPEDFDRLAYPEERVTKIIEPAPKYSLKEHWTLARNADGQRLDIFHAPHYVLPYFMKTPAVVTVHDAIHVIDPSYGFAARTYARVMIGSAVKRARAVITVSQRTKEDLVELFEARGDKIRVIPNGGGGDFTRPPEPVIISTLSQMGIQPGYFLFVGSDRPHKNQKAVAEVLNRLDNSFRFAIAGRTRPEARKIFEKFGSRVTFVDFVDKTRMAALYSGAAALLFPSYHEGFGLPPLEAMACGTPVVASNRSSIPEVVGDAAVLVDPDDYESMAYQLREIAMDNRYRAELARKGHERVKIFSWRKMAEATLEVYEAAVR
ncbi:MAG: glycosyltransferase family 4 protein [Nitrospinae bacterium]|nr:glycosyltransferase family 4 protein [Nitrospinota bacterium]